MRILLSSVIIGLALPAINGCYGCRDISASEAVTRSDMIGKCYVLKKDARVVEVRHLNRLMAISGDKLADSASGEEPVCILASGTKLTVTRVENCTYPPGLSIDFTIARIDDGPLKGTLVTTNRIGLVYTDPTVNEWDIAVPCVQASPGVPKWSPPAPEAARPDGPNRLPLSFDASECGCAARGKVGLVLHSHKIETLAGARYRGISLRNAYAIYPHCLQIRTHVHNQLRLSRAPGGDALGVEDHASGC
jgi:hypothetical protein